MTDKEIDYEFCECITALGRLVDEVDNDIIKEKVWDKWGEIETELVNYFFTNPQEEIINRGGC